MFETTYSYICIVNHKVMRYIRKPPYKVILEGLSYLINRCIVPWLTIIVIRYKYKYTQLALTRLTDSHCHLQSLRNIINLTQIKVYLENQRLAQFSVCQKQW